MEVIATKGRFKIEFNGGKTYFVTDEFGICWKAFDTERTAKNYLNKL